MKKFLLIISLLSNPVCIQATIVKLTNKSTLINRCFQEGFYDFIVKTRIVDELACKQRPLIEFICRINKALESYEPSLSEGPEAKIIKNMLIERKLELLKLIFQDCPEHFEEITILKDYRPEDQRLVWTSFTPDPSKPSILTPEEKIEKDKFMKEWFGDCNQQ